MGKSLKAHKTISASVLIIIWEIVQIYDVIPSFTSDGHGTANVLIHSDGSVSQIAVF